MSYLKRIMVFMTVIVLMFTAGTYSKASMAKTASQSFSANLSKQLNQYIKKAGGDITLQYRDLTTKEQFQIKGKSSRAAASTIKLPLMLYVIELVKEKKLSLSEKLTYHKSDYYGGSGVIQCRKVGTKFTVNELIKDAMVHSDNIAFIMLKKRVGAQNFIHYIKKLGGQYAYPNGQNKTSANDLIIYAQKLYDLSKTNPVAKEVVTYLEQSDYNTTIPKGIKGVTVAHKVGLIPMDLVYNDVGIIYDAHPFALAVMTNHISYAKSQKVIADIASIVCKNHRAKYQAAYFKMKKTAAVYENTTGHLIEIGKLSKAEMFERTADKGTWIQLQFGSRKGYVRRADVTPYSVISQSGFAPRGTKQAGVVKMKKNTTIMSSTSKTATSEGVLNKGQSIGYLLQAGNFYKVAIGNRVGYIRKSDLH